MFFTPIYTFICYRIIITVLRFIVYIPGFEKINKLHEICDPTWGFLSMLYNAFLPGNMKTWIWLAKIVVIVVCVLFIVYTRKYHYIKNYIIHVWWLIGFVYIGCLLYYSVVKIVNGACHVMSTEFLDYSVLLFIGLFAIQEGFKMFQGIEPIIKGVGWLLLLTTIVFYVTMYLCYGLQQFEAKILKHFKSPGSFIEMLSMLNQQKITTDIFIKYIFTSANFSTIATLIIISMYLIMNMIQYEKTDGGNDQEEDRGDRGGEGEDDNETERLTQLHSLLMGLCIFTFIIVSLFAFNLSDYFDISRAAFYYSLAAMIVACIFISVYRMLYIQKRKEMIFNKLEDDEENES